MSGGGTVGGGESIGGLRPGAYRLAPPPHSRLEILVSKEGMLSTMGHDLFVDATRLSGRVRIEPGRVEIEVTVEAAGVKTRCARHGDDEDRRALSASDLRSVDENLQREVLQSRKSPSIVFRASEVGRGATARGIVLPGMLYVAGRSGRIVLEAEQPEPGRPRFLVQSRFRQTEVGLTPYRAFLGALRVQDEVRVRGVVELQAEPD